MKRIVVCVLMLAFSYTLPLQAQTHAKYRCAWESAITHYTGHGQWTTESVALSAARSGNGFAPELRHRVEVKRRFLFIIPLPAKHLPSPRAYPSALRQIRLMA